MGWAPSEVGAGLAILRLTGVGHPAANQVRVRNQGVLWEFSVREYVCKLLQGVAPYVVDQSEDSRWDWIPESGG